MKYRPTSQTSYNARMIYGRHRLRSSTDYLNLLMSRITALEVPSCSQAVALLAARLVTERKYTTLRASVLKTLKP